MYQKYLDEEAEIILAIKSGYIHHPELNMPDRHIETGLAHIFFFGERVFKQYKIVNDPEHFIKGLLAPTQNRHDFLLHDFTLNQHFGGGVYKNIYSHGIEEGVVKLSAYEDTTPHVWFEMERLDFSQNFHEMLLRNEVSNEQLFELGQYTAQSVANSPVQVPTGLNWYLLAHDRVKFLEQFIAWLPDEYRIAMDESGCINALKKHLEENRVAYELIQSDDLVVSMDNHDENIFFRDSGPVFIDVVPPMQSWWYGVPWINLANIVVNVETLLSPEAARTVEAGFMEYHNLVSLPKKEYAFTRALAYAISVAHFGSIAEKSDVADLYLAQCQEIKRWL